MSRSFPKAKAFKPGKNMFPCLVEEKLDGMRIELSKGFCCSRKQSAEGYWVNFYKDLPEHIQMLAKDFPMDGEILWPGHPASDVKTAIIAESPELIFVPYRKVGFSGFPHEHYEELSGLGSRQPILPFGFEYITAPDADSLLELASVRGFEGWILKERWSSETWWKLKLEETYDLVVTGINIATAGQHYGKLKSLICSAYVNGEFVIVANVSGMDNETRYSVTENDIGRVVEVKANLLASKGRLRHPRFIRWRDDKPASECIINGE